MKDIGGMIYEYRNLRKMTQDEFASRLGVTPQAVSKWERGNGLPDVSLLAGICNVLDMKADTLLGMSEKVVENGNPLEDMEIKSNLIAEPIVLEFSDSLIPMICDGLEKDVVHEYRRNLARKTGILLPIIRFRDNVSLKENEWQILVYDQEVMTGVADSIESGTFENLIQNIAIYCEKHYENILNKHMVKLLIDNLKSKYPGIAEGVIPEQIPYIVVEQRLKEKLKKKEGIKDLIHIVEELELELIH